MHYFCKYVSPLGSMTIAANEENKLIGLWFDDAKYFGSTLPKDETAELLQSNSKKTPCNSLVLSQPKYTNRKITVLEETKEWLDCYFKGGVPDFTPQIFPTGSPFRMTVFKILQTVPYGRTMTYGEIAGLISAQNNIKKMSAQAVGGAVGHNPIAIIIPCHRIIGADGNLTGYAGGTDRKLKLLMLEKAIVKYTADT